ncbi:MAG: AAA family ATPase [Deltaproteobacteria bacterium]|jgi:general secretion pathway protein A|nr:AAA family ATPase [Deltaproteobacteria bacterium]MCW8893956.1 AAA family ATPase [Deltaproteobacteria bacterium]MCW9050384.1 AAA family ATPase [Deltaproteobacteria bacterium]
MYKDYFGLKEEPFSIAPDPQFLYMSERHREALAHLIYGMKADSGFVLLTGEVGTGKTTVCRCLLGQIPDNSEIAFILNPKLSVVELLATICDELKIAYPSGRASVKVFVDLINSFLLNAHAQGKQTVLIIDEAQNLQVDVLEQIRLLTNLETDKHKLLQVIMLGQPELNSMLERSELRQLAQRVTARYHLEPLGKNELESYLHHRLAVAGVERPLFPKAAVNKLYSLTNGVPRLINLLCDRALLGAYVKGQSVVSPELLKEAATEIFGRKVQRQERGSSAWHWLYVILLSLILVTGIVFLVALFRLMPAKTVNEVQQPTAKIEIMQPPIVAAEPLRWTAEEPASMSSVLAYQVLFRLWGFDDVNLDQGARKQAADLGLELLTKRASLGRLKQLNRPAVLKIVDPQGDNFYATLTGLTDEMATLVIGTDVHQVAVSQLVQQWFGDYGLMWQPPAEYQGVVKPGETGPLVYWLEQKMAILTNRPPTIDSGLSLKGELLEEIQAFQKTAGIEADGVVGPHTLMLLNTRVGDGQPTLYQ